MLKTPSLPPYVISIILNKGTEPPFSGKYSDENRPGTYLCRQCGLALFRAHNKFHSGCGWPSFDEEIASVVHYEKDQDGMRTEILCARCSAHLGHVFHGENFTIKNTRHCVNSFSLDHVEDKEVLDTEEAILAGGCFWGVEYLFQKYPGVLKTEVGYTGGHKINPTYEEVCSGTTGHLEAIRVIYDPKKVSYEQLTSYFFEIHDPTQADGQGPDRGEQYLSAIFYYDGKQKKTAQELIKILTQKGYLMVTRVLPVNVFWLAEEYHQNYCHRHPKNF